MIASPESTRSFLDPDAPLGELAAAYLARALAGDRAGAERLVLEAVEEGASVADLYLQVFQPVQHEVGRLWSLAKISVAREHFVTATTQFVMARLYPYLFEDRAGTRPPPREGRRPVFLAATVSGDLHELGLRMVSDFFEMAGWDSVYLGAGVPLEGWVEFVTGSRPDVVGISATLGNHLPAVEEVIEAIREAAQSTGTPPPAILVGGHPFNADPGLWRQVGADGHAADARQAVVLAESLRDARDARPAAP